MSNLTSTDRDAVEKIERHHRAARYRELLRKLEAAKTPEERTYHIALYELADYIQDGGDLKSERAQSLVEAAGVWVKQSQNHGSDLPLDESLRAMADRLESEAKALRVSAGILENILLDHE